MVYFRLSREHKSREKQGVPCKREKARSLYLDSLKFYICMKIEGAGKGKLA